ncbi:hypothetical protein [Saccharothrix coeruleofusca]|uniref:hypothetical protein n=1 Tax=Saccharothrix coeruleofusca TaxID=33919 RepID=UPI0016706034|nr:hypothetical protein [Saccharothrix coeruleofusca]MBP2337029.1 hypothetical protein [Saccharothrix coeruleofusca]
MKRTFIAVGAALLAVAGCSGAPDAPVSAPAPDYAAMARPLLLPEEVTAAKGLVRAGEPVEGVTALVQCPDLASAGQAAAGITTAWTWSGATQQAKITQYGVVYRDVAGKDVVKQARAASGCHRDFGSVESALHIDEYFYTQENQGPTKPFVDDRYAYCLVNSVRAHQICTALQAKGDRVVRMTIDITGPQTDLDTIKVSTFAQAVTDRLVA